MKIKAPISPGEFFDKLTILINKIYHCEEEHDVKFAVIALCELAGSCPGETMGSWNLVSETVRDLRNANKTLWKLEKSVRGEDDDHKRLLISDEIRNVNYERWEYKNYIDEQWDGTQEVKDYDV